MSEPQATTDETDLVDYGSESSESDLDSDDDSGESKESKPAGADDSLSSPSDERFHQPAPSPYKRAALLVFTILLFWLALSMRTSLWQGKKAPKVIYASRYSKEHRFRPAASPIITETLKDGRLRIRGAGPTSTPAPAPTPTPKRSKYKRRRRTTAKRSTKKPTGSK